MALLTKRPAPGVAPHSTMIDNGAIAKPAGYKKGGMVKGKGGKKK